MTTGGTLIFGTYPQTADGTDKTPIQWNILHNSGKELLILSKYILDCRRYHGARVDITWAECDLRKWLNDGFYQTAFHPVEREAILISHCRNNGGDSPNTDDRIFLLSAEEAREFTCKGTCHSAAASRQTVGTEFAKKKKTDGCKLYEYNKRGTADYITESGHVVGCSWWWLRTQGQKAVTECGSEKINDATRAFFVGTHSSIRSYGWVNLSGYGVRPALWLNFCVARQVFA